MSQLTNSQRASLLRPAFISTQVVFLSAAASTLLAVGSLLTTYINHHILSADSTQSRFLVSLIFLMIAAWAAVGLNFVITRLSGRLNQPEIHFNFQNTKLHALASSGALLNGIQSVLWLYSTQIWDSALVSSLQSAVILYI